MRRTHSSVVSKELTAQAESEFMALMELMAGISRRSSSLKEVWTKMITERETCITEMERMYDQFDEFTETIERKEKEHHHHAHGHEEQKKEAAKLRIEITAALASVAEYKKKLTDRDTELGNARREIREYKETISRVREEHELTKKTLEETQLKLVVCEDERHHAREDAQKHHGELRSLTLRFNDLQTSYNEITTKHEIAHKELVSIRETLIILKREKHEWLHEKGEFEEELRKCHHKYSDLSLRLEEMTEKFEKKEREVTILKESVTKLEYERQELHVRIEELKRKLEEKRCGWEDAEDRCGKWKLKWEHSEREIASIREDIRIIESEKSELTTTIAKIREEIRVLIIEKDRLSDEYHHECRKSEEHHRKVISLQESLRRVETTVKEKTESIHTLNERIERIESERDDARGRCEHLSMEIEQLQTSVVSLKAEISLTVEKHDDVCNKLRECESRYDEVCESITEYQGGHSEFEYEITTLRTMLREARDQKEKAITARNTADRERDEAISRYEEKCRELERFDEQMSQHFHAHGKSEGRSRVVSRSIRKVHEHHDGHSSSVGSPINSPTYCE